MKALNEYSFAKSGADTKKIVIFLHGYGADGKDLISIAPMWSEHLPNTIFYAPNAPEPCEMSPQGFQWFSLRDRSPHAMQQGADKAHEVLKAYIQQKCDAHGLTMADVAVVGFSQGTMMALYSLPRMNAPCAGVVGFSGRAVSAPPQDASPFPIVAIHGKRDEVVPFESLQHLADTFGGWNVATFERPHLGHGIDEEGLKTGFDFLKTHLKA